MPGPIRFATKLALVVALAASIAQAQTRNQTANPGQNQNGNGGGPGGPGGPGGGPGGPGGGPGGRPGGWGGPGGPGGGNTPSSLLQIPVVQDELKLTDKVKESIKKLAEAADKERTQVRDNVTKQATAAAAEAAAIAAENGNGQVFDPNANNGGNGNNNGGGGGRGGRGGGNPAIRQAVNDAMAALQVKIDNAFLKLLDARQKTRIKQIALQAEGANAFLQPDLIEKLGLMEEQVQTIQTIRDESRNSQRQIMGQLFGGGPGGGRGQRPDPATFQTPEFQAKVKEVEGAQKKNTNDTMEMIAKALSKAQRSKYRSMIGEPFDVSSLRGGMMARFLPPTPPNGVPAATTAATPAATTAATPATATPAAATPAAPKTARKSLRDSRGGGTPQP